MSILSSLGFHKYFERVVTFRFPITSTPKWRGRQSYSLEREWGLYGGTTHVTPE